MALTENDLVNIKDIVEFAIEQSEIRADVKFDKIEKRFDKIDDRLEKVEHRLDHVEEDIECLIETNQAFLDKFQDHEVRICKLEKKAA